MKVSVKKTGKTSDKLLKTLRDLNNESVSVGHFKEQGTHGDSDLTYPELLAIWATGQAYGNEGIIKNPKANFMLSLQRGDVTKSSEFKAAMRKWAKNALQTSSNVPLLDAIGKLTVDQYREVFGIVGPFMPSKGSNTTPMLDTHELAMATAYRTSKNKTIKEG